MEKVLRATQQLSGIAFGIAFGIASGSNAQTLGIKQVERRGRPKGRGDSAKRSVGRTVTRNYAFAAQASRSAAMEERGSRYAERGLVVNSPYRFAAFRRRTDSS